MKSTVRALNKPAAYRLDSTLVFQGNTHQGKTTSRVKTISKTISIGKRKAEIVHITQDSKGRNLYSRTMHLRKTDQGVWVNKYGQKEALNNG